MLLFPKNIKYTKRFSRRKRLFGYQKTQKTLLGDFTLKALERGKINNKQLEAIRRTSRRILKKQGKSWLNLFPNSAITKKSDGARMGKGKGNHKVWVCLVNEGTMILELKGCHWKQAKDCLLQAKRKISLKTLICLNKNLIN